MGAFSTPLHLHPSYFPSSASSLYLVVESFLCQSLGCLFGLFTLCECYLVVSMGQGELRVFRIHRLPWKSLNIFLHRQADVSVSIYLNKFLKILFQNHENCVLYEHTFEKTPVTILYFWPRCMKMPVSPHITMWITANLIGNNSSLPVIFIITHFCSQHRIVPHQWDIINCHNPMLFGMETVSHIPSYQHREWGMASDCAEEHSSCGSDHTGELNVFFLSTAHCLGGGQVHEKKNTSRELSRCKSL